MGVEKGKNTYLYGKKKCLHIDWINSYQINSACHSLPLAPSKSLLAYTHVEECQSNVEQARDVRLQFIFLIIKGGEGYIKDSTRGSTRQCK